MEERVHPIPFRTRQLSPPSPKVLQRQAAGGQGVALMQGALARMPVPGRPWGPHGDRSEGSIRSRPRPSYEEGWVQGLALLVPLA